ncbi:M20 metallopeptidase family protein [Streptomonospora salina]|uniref:Hippurate hydrolase n=1 Tax=Streptomonospora salina TaxID=104205 RepID=A0A841EG36_9ACTN|nr:M20 family metallopeptidase [Streptomonospora salina]MBB5998381.1 hippurate hydrolase [Streptomonospora salina]
MHTRTAFHNDLVRIRRALHHTPETGLHLPRTQEQILTELDGLGLEVRTGSELTSVTAVLQGRRPGPVVLLRADMDALPVTEHGTEPFASQHPGMMHACGHDLHMAMLVGAARLLRDAEFAGSVVLMFQPGEEGCGGAELMVREGVLDAGGDRPVAAYALHVVASNVPSGLFVSRPGVVLGASDTLRLTLLGSGGHSAMPHMARSPIPAACAIAGSAQSAVGAAVDPFDPALATVTTVHAGEADNAIPDRAEVVLSVRSYSATARGRARDAIVRLAEGTAAAHGVEVRVCPEDGYPVTRNDPQETAFAAATVQEVFGADRYVQIPRPLPMSEDFAYVLDEVPGAYMSVGACPPDRDPATAAPNHSPEAAYDDGVLADGARLYAELALRRLAAA